MPFPLALALAAGSGASSLLGNILARPRRSTFDPMAIYRNIEAANNSALNSQLSQTRSQLGASLGARGLSGGAAQSILANMEGTARGQAAAQNSRTLAELLGQKSMLDDQYQSDKSQWLGNLFGDLGNAGGSIAGTMLGVQGQKGLTEDELSFLIDRLSSLNNSDPNFVPRILAGGSNRSGGWNPISARDMRTRTDGIGMIPQFGW